MSDWIPHLHQLPPRDDFAVWLLLGGRGAGKTRAGAEWVLQQARQAPDARIALIGNTIRDVFEVMVEGVSGIASVASDLERPKLSRSARRLEFPNGAQAFMFSAHDPQRLRGPQFSAAWCDELGKWRYPDQTWNMLQFGMRLGDRPRIVVTTTPRSFPLLQQLLADPDTTITRASTHANAAHLPKRFMQNILKRYENTVLGRQEIDGELCEEVVDAMWTRALIDRQRLSTMPDCDFIVVGVDPVVSDGERADTCGIIAVGVRYGETPEERHYYVLADQSIQGVPPRVWSEQAIACYKDLRAGRMIVESNQGGNLLEETVRQHYQNVSYKGVYADRSKALRAEPIAALYERGLVSHVGNFPDLEDEMCVFTRHSRFRHGRSPDRVDALVWALQDLSCDTPMIVPQVRFL